jgi:hypothetical protein
MFGFRGGETENVVVRKRRHMKDAQEKWPFLTNYDCSTITTADQLSSMIAVRASIAERQAKQDVSDWMRGRTF